MGPRNAAIWYAQDGFDPTAKGINGRRVAGESFLKGFLRHAEVDEFVLLSKLPEDVEPVRALAEELRPGVPLREGLEKTIAYFSEVVRAQDAAR